MSEAICRSLDLLHPCCRASFRALYDELVNGFAQGRTKTKFEVFETYRSPLRQAALYRQRPAVTRADAWESSHNYGLAVDFVPRNGGQWSWDESHDWDFLDRIARSYDLVRRISWDRPHIEAPEFLFVRSVLK